MKTDSITKQLLNSQFKKVLRNSGYLITSQRERILEQLLRIDSHFDIESFFHEIRKKKMPVSRATVYRTVACLEKAGLIRKVNFDEAHAHYEIVGYEKVHHEHLICQICGKVIEFSHEHFEKHIHEIADSYGFRITSHSLELFGTCAECFMKEKKIF